MSPERERYDAYRCEPIMCMLPFVLTLGVRRERRLNSKSSTITSRRKRHSRIARRKKVKEEIARMMNIYT